MHFIFAAVALSAAATSAVSAPTTCYISNTNEALTGEFTYSLSAGGDKDWAVLQMAGTTPVHYECPEGYDGCFNRDVASRDTVDMIGLINRTTLVRSVTIVDTPAASTMLHYQLSNCK